MRFITALAAMVVGLAATLILAGWLLGIRTNHADPHLPELHSSPDAMASLGAPSIVASSPRLSVGSEKARAEIDLSGQGRRIELPGVIRDLAVAANGRYLVLRLADAPHLHIYDVVAGRIRGQIPADDEPVCFAGGREKVVVGLWGQSAIQRWSLTTLQMETERLVAGDDAPLGMAMGADSPGPVLCVMAGRASGLLDLETLQQLSLPDGAQTRPWKHYETSQHRCSADGRVICSWDYHSLVAGVNVLSIGPDGITYSTYDDSVGHVCPNASGTRLFTAVGRYRIDERPNRLGEPPGFVVPAVNGPHYLRIQVGDGIHRPLVALFTEQKSEPIATICGLEFPFVADVLVRRAFDSKLQTPLPPDERIMLIPEVHKLVTVGVDQKSLYEWPIDLGRLP
jgi:hypothetical protein